MLNTIDHTIGLDWALARARAHVLRSAGPPDPPSGSPLLAPARPGSVRLAPARSGSVRLAPAPSGSLRLAPARPGSVRLAPARSGRICCESGSLRPDLLRIAPLCCVGGPCVAWVGRACRGWAMRAVGGPRVAWAGRARRGWAACGVGGPCAPWVGRVWRGVPLGIIQPRQEMRQLRWIPMRRSTIKRTMTLSGFLALRPMLWCARCGVLARFGSVPARSAGLRAAAGGHCCGTGACCAGPLRAMRAPTARRGAAGSDGAARPTPRPADQGLLGASRGR